LRFNQLVSQAPSTFLSDSIPVLRPIEMLFCAIENATPRDGGQSRAIADGAVGWSPPMEQGLADECKAEIHASEARDYQEAIKCEQERRPLGCTRILKIE
jgi:hypothetical protein